jgi:hypothetical protein
MNETEIRNRLVNEFGYPPKGAEIILDKISKSAPEVQKAILDFIETGGVTAMEVEGYSLTQLRDEHGMKVIAAYLTLDWLIREPEKAKASLKKGHDFVG